MKTIAIFLVASALSLASSCSSSSSGERATLGNLEYEVPRDWVAKDLSTQLRPMIRWTPAGHNERAESIVVALVERNALAKAAGDYLPRLLADAQKSLPGAKFGIPTQLATRSGLVGAMIEGSFTPPGQTQVYRRIHAVLVEGGSILTVISTAREPDREAFEAVIDSFQTKRGG